MFGVPVRMFPRNPLPAVALDGHSIDLRAFHYATSCKQKTFFLHLLWVEKFTCICHSTFSGKNFMCRLSWSISNHFGAIFLLKCASQAEIAKNLLKPPIQAPSGNILRDKLVLVEFLILLNFKYYLRISPQDNEECHLKFGLCVCALSQRHGSVFFNIEIRLRNSLLPPSASFLAWLL